MILCDTQAEESLVEKNYIGNIETQTDATICIRLSDLYFQSLFVFRSRQTTLALRRENGDTLTPTRLSERRDSQSNQPCGEKKKKKEQEIKSSLFG